MKQHIKFLVALSVLLAVHAIKVTPQSVSTFDDLLGSPDGYWNGSYSPLGASVTSGNATFRNYYDTAYGGFWASGWAISSMRDSVTPGDGNLYSARPGKGADSSLAYAVGTQGAIIKIGSASALSLKGFYITNSTYSAKSMEQGDGFAKKFGGTTGSEPDWFKLTVRKYLNGVINSDSIEYYLSDYRFSDSTLDYIVNDWRWVDISALGKADSLVFYLTSSDVGQFGMNTPAYFCMDNLIVIDSVVSAKLISTEENSLKLYPNPSAEILNVAFAGNTTDLGEITIYNLSGDIVYKENLSAQGLVRRRISLNNFPVGIYYLKCNMGNVVYEKFFVKGE